MFHAILKCCLTCVDSEHIRIDLLVGEQKNEYRDILIVIRPLLFRLMQFNQ